MSEQHRLQQRWATAPSCIGEDWSLNSEPRACAYQPAHPHPIGKWSQTAFRQSVEVISLFWTLTLFVVYFSHFVDNWYMFPLNIFFIDDQSNFWNLAMSLTVQKQMFYLCSEFPGVSSEHHVCLSPPPGLYIQDLIRSYSEILGQKLSTLPLYKWRNWGTGSVNVPITTQLGTGKGSSVRTSDSSAPESVSCWCHKACKHITLFSMKS